MIVSQWGGTNPEQSERGATEAALPAYHLTCKQVGQLAVEHDDISYRHLPLSKVVLCGRVIVWEKASSPKGAAVINVRLQDSAGTCRVMFYAGEGVDEELGCPGYVKLGVSVKCRGLPYHPQLSIVGYSVAPLPDPNELTEHQLQCMRTQVQAPGGCGPVLDGDGPVAGR